MKFTHGSDSHAITRLYSIFLCALLAACNSASNSAPPVAQPLQGFLEKPAVVGVSYSTQSLSGITGAGGQFDYMPGETVTFSLGATELGSVAGAASINWFDLAQLEDIPVGHAAFNQQDCYNRQEPSLIDVMNLGIFLQTWDLDNNPDNGVEISANTRQLLENESIDLKQEYWQLQESKSLARLIRQAARDNTLSARAIRAPGAALQTVYDAAAIDPRLFSAGLTQDDDDADGIFDRSRQYQFNNAGKIVRYDSDSDADGSPNLTYLYSYSNNSLPNTRTIDNDGDGVVDFSYSWQWDEFGKMIYREEDNNADGTPHYTESIDYDENGVLVRRETINTVSGLHTIQVFTVDADGNRPRYELDEDGDGNVDRIDTLVYDSFGNWITRGIDRNLDGQFDEYTERSFRADGRRLFERRDTDNDGNFDYADEYTYDSNGRLVNISVDTDGDGQTNRETRYEYNEAGKQTLYWTDNNGDGIPERTTANFYDSEGNQTRTEFDINGDQITDRISTYTFDSDGNTLSYSYDSNADGSANTHYNYVYQDEFRVRTEFDRLADGVVDSVTVSSQIAPSSLIDWF